MIRLKYLSAFTAFFLLYSISIQAQQVQQVEDLVRWSPEGMVVFSSDAALSEENPQNGIVEAVVYRSIGDDLSFEEIARLQRASSWEEFENRASVELVQTLMEETESTSEEELWNFIKENPDIQDYGFNALDTSLWKAFGTAYFDEESLNFSQGERIFYQVRYILEDGSESNTLIQGSEIVGAEPNLAKVYRINRTESDTLVGGTWTAPLEGSEDAVFGRVYRQVYPDEEFELLDNLTMATFTADSTVSFRWLQQAEPERTYRFFIEPMDIVGNVGPRSDTLVTISANFNNLPLMGEVTATDSTTGIHLSWEQLPQKPYLTGIEIRRSRDARQDFITLDTLSIQSTEYMDTQVVPNLFYYYEFRIVTMRNTNSMPSSVASATFTNEMMPPSPPSALRAERKGTGIRLNWEPVDAPDLFAYYVYRGTSRYDSLVVASPAIQDTTTFFDDNEMLSGRTNYVYAVKAVSLSQMESEFSNMVFIRPDRIIRPPAPTGIEGYAEQKRVRLFWGDQRRRDGAVAGYHVYRTSSLQEISPDSAAANIQAEQSGFVRVNDSLLTSPSFDDINVESGQTYYYSVSSVDIFDVESMMSNPAPFTPSMPSLRPPSQVSVRSVTGGIELRWNQTLQDGAIGYRIFRRGEGQSEPVAIGLNDIDETRFLDQNVSQGELYWYAISVVGDNRESEASREESVRAD